MVVMDQWGSLWGNVFSRTTRSWHGWRQSGGGLVGLPSVAVGPDGVAWVVVRSSFNALWLTSLAPGGFSGNWTSLGGIVDGDPAITITSAGVAYIVARDDIGRVWLVRAVNGAFQDWSLLGGVILGDPAVVAGLNGTAHVIARDPNTYPWVATINGTTPTWTGIATALDSPAAGIHVDNVVTVTAIRGGQVWSAPFFVASPPSWGTWSPLGQAATAASAASDETRLMVAARDPAGQLVWYKAGMGWSTYGALFAGGPLSAAPTGRSTSFGSFPTTIATSPLGLTVSVDGVNCTAPCTFQWFPGSSHTIAAQTSQQSQGSTYWFSYWSDGLGQTHAITGLAGAQTITATMVASSDPLQAVRDCLKVPSGTILSLTCTIPVGTHAVSETLTINRSQVTMEGANPADRNQTKLLRAQAFENQPIIRVGDSNRVNKVTLKNFTICGSSILDGQGVSSVGCPRVLTKCGEEVAKTSPAYICTDLEISNASLLADPATGNLVSNPFDYQGHYAVTIANLDLEDSAGHAVALWSNQDNNKRVDDIYVHDSAINNSEVTGILYGTQGMTYHTSECDRAPTSPAFSTDKYVYAPHNLRIENNTFRGNFTGAMGGGAVRFVMLKNNIFENNYRDPQAGNEVGGTLQFDPCADTIHIIGNTLTGPNSYLNTDGMELYSRSLLISGNTVSNFGREGITLNSILNATVQANLVNGNARALETGGILISTSESVTGPCGDPRETNTATLTSNVSTNQKFGVHLHDHDAHSTNVIHNVTIGPTNTLSPFLPNGGEVGLDSIVRLNSYSDSGRGTTPRASDQGPRVLTVRAVAPSTTRCKEEGQRRRQTFTFPAADARGTNDVNWIQGIFSVAGREKDGVGGPDSGAQGCHFIYFRESNTIYLDGPGGGNSWLLPASTVVLGAAPISHAYCTIYPGSPSSQWWSDGFTLNLSLDIEFTPYSGKRYIYTTSGDGQGGISDSGVWKYWGWWMAP